VWYALHVNFIFSVIFWTNVQSKRTTRAVPEDHLWSADHSLSNAAVGNCNIISILLLWDHRRICGPSLTETSLWGAWLFWMCINSFTLPQEIHCFPHFTRNKGGTITVQYEEPVRYHLFLSYFLTFASFHILSCTFFISPSSVNIAGRLAIMDWGFSLLHPVIHGKPWGSTAH
jgi:hypothetical protein